jgi:hypothetical protein
MTDDEFQENDELTPEQVAEEDRKDAELKENLRPFIEAGWKWEGTTGWLVDPEDSERLLIVDPFTREIVYSKKYWEPIKAEIERRKRSGDL